MYEWNVIDANELYEDSTPKKILESKSTQTKEVFGIGPKKQKIGEEHATMVQTETPSVDVLSIKEFSN